MKIESHMKYVTLLVGMLVFLSLDGVAQKKELSRALSNYDKGEYYLALDYYRQATEKGANLGLEDRKNIARCYYYLNNIERAYNAFEALENNLTGDDVFLYASTLHQFQLYELAIEWYEKAKLIGGSNTMHVEELISSCRWALNNNSYVDYLVNPSSLSTFGQSFGIQYYKNGVVYSSANEGAKNVDKQGKPFLNLFYSDVKDGDIVEGSSRIFSENLISPYHVGAIAFTSDYKYMYYTKSVLVGNSDRMKIFVVEFDGKDWINERELSINSNKFDCAHPALSPDDKYLFFVSNKNGGYGGKDIYWVERRGPNSFGTPENLGMEINTYADEIYPTVSKDNKLYFSSKGHNGFGGHDIFVAEYIDGKWQNVRNMMHPFNSNFDDFCYVIDPNDSTRGFLSTNNYQKGDADVIFYVRKISEPSNEQAVELPPVVGLENVISEADVAPMIVPDLPKPVVVEEKKPVIVQTKVNSTFNGTAIESAELKLQDASTGDVISTTLSDADGKAVMSIPGAFCDDEREYTLIASKDGYTPRTLVTSLEGIKDIERNGISLTPVFNDAVLDDISGMAFRYTGNDLSAESKETLDKLAAYLLSNPGITVKLNAHTEAKGNRYGNLDRSQKIADKAKDYLVAKGVNSDQLIPRGYGERYLLNRCRRGIYCDAAMHAQNRRVEIVVWKVKR